MQNEEINTRNEENGLRKEQGISKKRMVSTQQNSGFTLPEIEVK